MEDLFGVDSFLVLHFASISVLDLVSRFVVLIDDCFAQIKDIPPITDRVLGRSPKYRERGGTAALPFDRPFVGRSDMLDCSDPVGQALKSVPTCHTFPSAASVHSLKIGFRQELAYFIVHDLYRRARQEIPADALVIQPACFAIR